MRLLALTICLTMVSVPAWADTIYEPPIFEPTPQEIAEGGGETTLAEQDSELDPEPEPPDTGETLPVRDVPATGNVLPHRVQTNLPRPTFTHRHSKVCPKKSRVHARKCHKMGKRRSSKRKR